jgi:peroxiredoxin Q/BCP
MEEGNKAPNFTLEDKDGTIHKLESIKSKYTVVYFYPKDNTPGCTVEAQKFTELKKNFEKLDTTVIGISGGDQKSKTKFCEKHNLSIILLSDTEFKVSEKYGVYGLKKFMGREYMGINRITFILDKDKKIIKKYDKIKPLVHAQEVLDFINEVS